MDVKQTISAWIRPSIGPSQWTLDLLDLAADTKSRAQCLGTSGKTTTQDWRVSSATSLGVQIGRNKRGMSFTVWFEWWFAGFTALPSADSWGMVLEALSCSDGWCPDSNLTLVWGNFYHLWLKKKDSNTQRLAQAGWFPPKQGWSRLFPLTLSNASRCGTNLSSFRLDPTKTKLCLLSFWMQPIFIWSKYDNQTYSNVNV